MMSKTVVLLLGTLAIGCYGQCQQGNGNPIWRNQNFHGRGWGLRPMWSSFDDVLSAFDEPWFYHQPHHHIFNIGHEGMDTPQQLESDESERVPRHCHRCRNTLERQEEMERKQRLAELDREEIKLIKEKQEKAAQYTQEEKAFAKRQQEIDELRGEATFKHSSNQVDNFGNTEEQQRHKEMAEEQRLASERKAAEQRLLRQRQEEQQQREQAEQEAKQAAFRESQRQKAMIKEQRRQQSAGREQLRQQAAQREQMRGNMKLEIAKHRVQGYDPDDITVMAEDGRVKIEGKHICYCNENCISKEFTRAYALPPGVATSSISATLDSNGDIKVVGERISNRNVDTSRVSVKVQGIDIPQSTRPSAEQLRKCLGEKGGIKLSKINKRTGQLHVDDYKYEHEIHKPSVHQQADIDDDEGFVEAVDY